MRSKATIKRLKLYNVRPTRDKNGKITHYPLQNSTAPPGVILPDRRLFGIFIKSLIASENTRNTSATALAELREEMQKVVRDPYKVVLKHKSLPMSLLMGESTAKAPKPDLLSVESFGV